MPPPLVAHAYWNTPVTHSYSNGRSPVGEGARLSPETSTTWRSTSPLDGDTASVTLGWTVAGPPNASGARTSSGACVDAMSRTQRAVPHVLAIPKLSTTLAWTATVASSTPVVGTVAVASGAHAGTSRTSDGTVHCESATVS